MKKIFILLMVTFAFSACDKKLEVDAPSFDVRADEADLNYKVGDTVRFSFSGQANNITFYSGEPGADYNFRNRTEIEGGKPQVSFSSRYGSGQQLNSLSLMVSSDLTSVTQEGIRAATWTDVTDRGTLTTTAGPTVPSGDIDLTDLLVSGKPLYFAFKYNGITSSTQAAGNWVLSNWKAVTVLPNGDAIPVATLPTADWKTFDFAGPNTWYTRGGPPVNEIIMIGGGANAPVAEDWFVTKGLYFVQVPPDAGRAIQSVGTNALTTYEYVYTKPGTYNVTFLASNVTVDDQKSVLKQMTITVE